MEKLIFPGHIGKLEYIMPALQVYVEADDWVKTADYIDKEFAILKANGIESEMKDDKTDYTKDAELPRYFGFVERRTPGDVKSDCRITELGRLFYDAVKDKKQEDINEAVMTAFETVTFGKNNEGCPGSNTRLEAPNILLIASLMLDGVTRQEYAGILYEMLNNNAPIVNALVRIKLCREKNLPIANKVRVDNKVVPFLVNVGFLMEDGSYIKLNPQVRDDYQDRITKLPTTNDLENIFPEDDMKIIKFDDEPRQLIFYGAPGTGKSHEINVVTEGQSVIRTTFHPDSDYSTFVGSYKPTMGRGKVYGAQGPLSVDGKEIEEDRIVYTFVKQAFLKAYLSAWKSMSEGGDSIKPQFLIIEEINRGNCAQIFGDLFQLLDRSDSNYSTYPIVADSDLQQAIEKAFEEEKDDKLTTSIQADNAIKGYVSNFGSTLSDDIQHGRVLLLPPNMFIWATMNTSDQSLFPIDSAFKRRWGWRYIKIANGYERDDEGKFILDNGKRVPLNWKIRFKGKECDWWEFLQAINKQIGTATSSDDKKLGYFFCKPKKGESFIDEEVFVGKVVFYLWNDVFKDNDTSIFKMEGVEDEPSYDVFYTEDEYGKSVPNPDAIEQLIKNLSITIVSSTSGEVIQEGETGKYNYNGTPTSLRDIAKGVVLDFISKNPELNTAESIRDKFEESCDGFGTKVVKTEAEYHELDGQVSQEKNWQELVLTNGEKLYINTQWRAKNPDDNFIKFITIVQKNNWGTISPIA